MLNCLLQTNTQSLHEQTWKISNPAISRMPMNEAPCLCLRSRALLILWTSHLNRRSYVAFAKASTAKSAWRKKDTLLDSLHRDNLFICVRTISPALSSGPSARTLDPLWFWEWGWPGWTPARWCPAGGTVSEQLCCQAWRPGPGSSPSWRKCSQTGARQRSPLAWLRRGETGRGKVIYSRGQMCTKQTAFSLLDHLCLLHIDSSGVKPIIAMESMVWVKFSESLWPGTGMEPPLRKRYSSADPKSRSARDGNKKGETER